MENSNHQIGHREILTLLIIMMSGKVFLSFPRDMALLADSAGWLLVLLSGLFSLAGFTIIYALICRFPEDNLLQITRKIAGNAVGTILGLVFFFYFLTNTFLLVRQFAESFILMILPRTPISVITLFFMALLIYGTFLGIETISRVAWFFGPYLLLAMVIIIFSAAPTHLEMLLPLFGKGIGPVLKSAVIHIASFSEILFIPLIAPLIRKKDRIFKIGIWSISIATLILAGMTAVIIITFNYNSASHLSFPVFQLARLIHIGEFIHRVESVFVFLWFLTAGIEMSALFYGTVISFTETFRINNYRPLVFPLATLVFTLSLLPQSMSETVHWDDFKISKYYSAIWIGIPFLLWLIALTLNKKAGKTDA
ncbi:MAG TPA: endospore germination permease [Bacillota bacterium]